jgi:hypothetical protein
MYKDQKLSKLFLKDIDFDESLSEYLIYKAKLDIESQAVIFK